MSLAHAWGNTMDTRHGGLLVWVWMTRGSTGYGIENKGALMPDRGVHYLICILLCALLHLCVVVYVLFGCFGEYDPRNNFALKRTRDNNHMRCLDKFLLVLHSSQKLCNFVSLFSESCFIGFANHCVVGMSAN